MKKTKVTEKVVISKKWNEVMISHTKSHYHNRVAELALRMLADKALISAVNEGEDSAGRAVIKFAGVKEVVQRAFDISEAAYQEIDKRGLLIEAEVVEEKT